MGAKKFKIVAYTHVWCIKRALKSSRSSVKFVIYLMKKKRAWYNSVLFICVVTQFCRRGLKGWSCLNAYI